MAFDLQPILRGEFLALRPLRAEDFHDLSAVAAGPLIWEQHPVKDDLKMAKAWLRREIGSKVRPK